MVLSMNRSTEGKFYIFVFYTFFINNQPSQHTHVGPIGVATGPIYGAHLGYPTGT